MKTATRSFLLFLPVPILAGIFAFLLSSDFFSAWDGEVASVAAPLTDSRVDVLVVGDDGDAWRPNWPVAAVRGHDLPVDARQTRLVTPDDAPHTVKSRFRLYFFVDDEAGLKQLYPTTSVGSFNIAIITFLVLIFGRNMVTSGSPMRIERRKTELPHELPAAGQVAPRKQARPKKGPPPPHRRSRRR